MTSRGERMSEAVRRAWTEHRARLSGAVRMNALQHGAYSEECRMWAAVIRAARQLAAAAQEAGGSEP